MNSSHKRQTWKKKEKREREREREKDGGTERDVNLSLVFGG